MLIILLVFENYMLQAKQDTVKDVAQMEHINNVDTQAQIKSPSGAIWRSLACPGWGQLYCENYWKAPVFFAGAVSLWYVVIDNTVTANNYKNQMDAISDKASSEYNQLKNQRENSIDNRDMAGFFLLGVYTLAAIDAYTGSHLFGFNVGNNLQFYISPTSISTMPLIPNISLKVSYKF